MVLCAAKRLARGSDTSAKITNAIFVFPSARPGWRTVKRAHPRPAQTITDPDIPARNPNGGRLNFVGSDACDNRKNILLWVVMQSAAASGRLI
jgi:hypothetical protein